MRLRKLLKLLVVLATIGSGVALICSYLATMISPVQAPILPFFGLGYPVILVINLLFLLFWLFKHSRWSILVVVILLAGFNVHSAFFQWNPGSAPESGDKFTLRVMSYNVELFGWYYWADNIKRRNKIFKQLDENPADIYCFQEFFYTSVRERFDTRDTLMELLQTPHYFDYYTHEMHEVQFYGIATLSRHPIINSGVIEFPNDKNNACIYTDILVENDIIRVYNGHLCSIRFSGDEHEYVGALKSDPALLKKSRVANMYRRLKTAFVKRAWQAELIRDHMKKCPYPIILCGDFNDTPVSYAYGVFDRKLKDTFRQRGNGIGNTYIGNFPSFRIDYVFTSNHFEAISHKVLPEELGDHHAVCVELKMK